MYDNRRAGCKESDRCEVVLVLVSTSHYLVGLLCVPGQCVRTSKRHLFGVQATPEKIGSRSGVEKSAACDKVDANSPAVSEERARNVACSCV